MGDKAQETKRPNGLLEKAANERWALAELAAQAAEEDPAKGPAQGDSGRALEPQLAETTGAVVSVRRPKAVQPDPLSEYRRRLSLRYRRRLADAKAALAKAEAKVEWLEDLLGDPRWSREEADDINRALRHAEEELSNAKGDLQLLENQELAMTVEDCDQSLRQVHD